MSKEPLLQAGYDVRRWSNVAGEIDLIGKAEQVEIAGFGIVAAIIDIDGSGIALRHVLAAHKLAAALRYIVEWNRDNWSAETARDMAAEALAAFDETPHRSSDL